MRQTVTMPGGVQAGSLGELEINTCAVLGRFVVSDSFCDPVAPLSVEFSRHEYWSGLPFPPPGYLPDPGIEPGSPTSPTLSLSGRFFTISATWEAPSLTAGKLLLTLRKFSKKILLS